MGWSRNIPHFLSLKNTKKASNITKRTNKGLIVIFGVILVIFGVFFVFFEGKNRGQFLYMGEGGVYFLGEFFYFYKAKKMGFSSALL
jgi:hypothetical protein